MQDPLLNSFRLARAALEAERTALLARLAAVNEALALAPGTVSSGRRGRPRGIATGVPATADSPSPVPASPAVPATSGAAGRKDTPATRTSASPPRQGVRPEVGSLNLREAVILALADGPASRADILRRIHHLGYRFNKSNPISSLDQVLQDSRTGVVERGSRFALA